MTNYYKHAAGKRLWFVVSILEDPKPVGNVTVTSDGHLRIQATGDIVLTRDVEVQLGGELVIQ